MPTLPTSRIPYRGIEVEHDRVWVPDDTKFYFGNDGDVSFEYDEDGSNLLVVSGPANFPRPITNTASTVVSDTLVIPVTTGIVNKTIGGDAETLTLGDGTDGQLLLVNVTLGKGGRGTLTPDTSTGWATAQLSDTGDGLVLYFVDSSIGWVCWGAHGKAAPPVMT